MDNHSADPNQIYLARIRKLIHFTVRIQKTNKANASQKNDFFRSVVMLKLTTPKQNSHFQSFYGTRIRKTLTRIRNLFYTKRADPKFRIGTKHEAVPEKFRGMVIISWYGTVPH